MKTVLLISSSCISSPLNYVCTINRILPIMFKIFLDKNHCIKKKL